MHIYPRYAITVVDVIVCLSVRLSVRHKSQVTVYENSYCCTGPRKIAQGRKRSLRNSNEITHNGDAKFSWGMQK